MTRPYHNGNPIGFDAASTIATFAEPCPACGTRLQVTRGHYDWVQRTRIETRCKCGWAGVWFASPAVPVPTVGIISSEGVKQLELFTEER